MRSFLQVATLTAFVLGVVYGCTHASAQECMKPPTAPQTVYASQDPELPKPVLFGRADGQRFQFYRVRFNPDGSGAGVAGWYTIDLKPIPTMFGVYGGTTYWREQREGDLWLGIPPADALDGAVPLDIAFVRFDCGSAALSLPPIEGGRVGLFLAQQAH